MRLHFLLPKEDPNTVDMQETCEALLIRLEILNAYLVGQLGKAHPIRQRLGRS